MPRFSDRSLGRLRTCDKRLQRVFEEVIKHWDCTIIEGYRTKKRQDKFYKEGRSKVKFPNSKHNQMPSFAIDVAPYFITSPHIRWDDTQSFAYFAGFVLGIATSMGIKLRHGADWDKDKDTRDQSFMDWPHFELGE